MIKKDELLNKLAVLQKENDELKLKLLTQKKPIPTLPPIKSAMGANTSELRRDFNQLLEYIAYKEANR